MIAFASVWHQGLFLNMELNMCTLAVAIQFQFELTMNSIGSC